MKDVWHLFLSQVRALRWWLLVWLVALTAWGIARWTYLTEWGEFWMRQEKNFSYVLIGISVLLAAALIHLHPVAKQTAGWRTWPVRRWKYPAAQALFILFFFVLLPGAAEWAFLLHPKLAGFMGSGMGLWLAGSFWPLPLALGLASCSASLRRFLLDVLILSGIVAGSVALSNSRYILTTNAPLIVEYKGYEAVRWIIPGFVAGSFLLWIFSFKRRFSKTRRRAFFFLTPAVYALSMLVLPWISHPVPEYVLSGIPNDKELASRFRLEMHHPRLDPDRPNWVDATGLSVAMRLDGLRPEETADADIWQRKLITPEGEFRPPVSSGRTRSSTSFGNTYWDRQKSEAAPAGRDRETGTAVTARFVKEVSNGQPVRFEGTIVVSVRRTVEITRLPLRGGRWEEPGREVIISFAGAGEEARRRGIEGGPEDGLFVTEIIERRFGNSATKSSINVDLVYLPDRIQIQPARTYASVGSFWGMTPSYSTGTKQVQIYSTNTTAPSIRLIPRLLTHPGEFAFIITAQERVGSFSQVLTSEEIPASEISDAVSSASP